MRWIVYALAVLAALVAGVLVVGLLLPASHVASRSVTLRQTPEAVWAAIADFEGNPAWRTAVRRVTREPDKGGSPVWREESGDGNAILYETVESRPPTRLVRRIADPDLPFAGTWTIEITPEDGGSRVRVTEHGEVRNPIFRFVSRFLLGHTSHIDAYLLDLARHFGEAAEPA